MYYTSVYVHLETYVCTYTTHVLFGRIFTYTAFVHPSDTTIDHGWATYDWAVAMAFLCWSPVKAQFDFTATKVTLYDAFGKNLAREVYSQVSWL